MYVIIFFLASLASLFAQHPSPCPETFNYLIENSEPGKWTGQILLNSDFPLSGIWVKLLLDRKVYRVESNFGEIVSYEPKTHLIKDRDHNLVPGSPLLIPVTVYYPETEPIPSLVGIRLNGRVICPSPPKTVASKCPGVFSYSKDLEEDNRWHGSVVLNTEFELTGIWLRIVLDRPAELLGNEFGEVRTSDNLSYLISNRNYTLLPGRPLRVGFWVKYAPGGPVPGVHTVRLNGRTVCGDIIAEDNNYNVIYISLINKFNVIPSTASKVPDIPLRRPETSTPKPPLPFQPIFPPFNPRPITSTHTPTLIQATPPPHSTFISSSTRTETISTEATPTTTEDFSSNAHISCGSVVPESVNLIVSGERAHSAQWPWHGAIYLIKPNALDYICGMSLISEKHALTAAHCVVESISTKKIRDPKSLVLYFGLLNRKDFTASTVQKPTVNSIIVHNDYKVSENDIAVIKFNRKVKFTDWVRPVCLWEGDMDMRYIVNQTGTVVGFGVTETGAISDELLYANILVVDTPTCIFSHRDFYSKYTSLNTFCAGNLTQSAVCNGDSGGAMVFKRDGSDVWQIRGIVSTAVRNVENGLCDYNYYAIFSDVAKFTQWIEKALAS